ENARRGRAVPTKSRHVGQRLTTVYYRRLPNGSCIIAAWLFLFCGEAAYSQTNDAGLTRFRAILQELVETNTTLSAGDCTLAARRVAARLKAAGYPDQDVHVFIPDGHPKEGGLLAVLHGFDPNAKAVLLLAHLDVVEAKREDWARDPFKMIEENGYFYARGAADDKAMASAIVANMIRMKKEGFVPNRDIILALTADEEIIPSK